MMPLTSWSILNESTASFFIVSSRYLVAIGRQVTPDLLFTDKYNVYILLDTQGILCILSLHILS